MKHKRRVIATATLTSLWLVVAVGPAGAPAAASDPTSCKAIKFANPSAPSGIYTIDPDDAGPIAPVLVNCEMVVDGGGWTLGVKSWYGGGVIGNAGAVGTVGDGLAHKGNPYKLSDDVIRAFIGPSQNFDVMVDQSGYNSAYSTGNYERVILRNYTGFWRFDAPVAASTTQTVMQSYRKSDGALAWTGELGCGFVSGAGAGINCEPVVSNNPQGGAGCGISMGSATHEGWHHFFMSVSNSDTFLYICNGAQHSSNHDMNHRWWFRETAAPPADTTAPTIALTNPADGATYGLNEAVLAEYGCEDETGLASCIGNVPDGSPIDTSTVRGHSFTVDAVDNAANTATVTHDYSVAYSFKGFLHPASAGKPTSLSFRVTDANGAPVSGLSTIVATSAQFACAGGPPSAPVQASVEVSSAGDGFYVLVWKTLRAYKGQCRVLEVDLGDGVARTAQFRFA